MNKDRKNERKKLHNKLNAQSKKGVVKGTGSIDRRNFLQKSVVASMGIMLGADLVYGNYFPKNLIPVGLINGNDENPIVFKGTQKM